MSDIEIDSDDDRSVNSDDSDVHGKMKEFNSKLKTKLPFDNDGSGEEDASDEDSNEDENEGDENDDDDDDGSILSSDMEDLDKEMGEDVGLVAPPVANNSATNKKKKTTAKSKQRMAEDEDEFINEMNDGLDDDDNEEAEIEEKEYLRKFDASMRRNIISEHHQELLQHNTDEIQALLTISRGTFGEINDPLHRTLPFLTKYERARILGERAKQINAGAKPLVKIPDTLIDGYLIALKELEQKVIPFIIKRPLPNGGCEYWKLKDLEIL
jgi:DNA-directed RNA polymerase subunit K/omega